MNVPRISVVLPTYNGESFLAQAIDSVLNQTIENIELVIGDDASTDGTRALLESYASRDSRISVVFNETNLGYVRNQVATFKRCRGEFIKTYAQDDALEPNCCEVMLKAFDDHPSVSLVSVSRKHIDEEGTEIGINHKYEHSGLFPGRDMIKLYMKEFFNRTGNTSQIMFRRKDAEKGFNPAYNHGEDVEFALRILEKGDFFYIAEPLLRYRIHRETTTIKTLVDMSFMSDHVRLIDRFGSYALADGVTKDELWNCAIQGLIAKMGHAMFTRGITYDDFPVPLNWDQPKIGDDFENDEPASFRRLACHLIKFVTEKNFASKEAEQLKLAELSASTGDNQRLLEEIKKLEEHIKKLSEDNTRLKESSSWKMTAPLRKLRRYLHSPRPQR
jgi:glycosyltransferase involved in cell wall biosynthesis